MSIDKNLNDVAARLRDLQDHYGLTLQEMADKCSMPKRSLENYMKLNKPQRPGLDALRALADGMNVSIDWLVGRSKESLAPEFTTEDYAFFCHSVVLRLLSEIISAADKHPIAFDAKKHEILGEDYTDIAAIAMLDFIEVVKMQAGNVQRPSGYFQNHYSSISRRAAQTSGERPAHGFFGGKP